MFYKFHFLGTWVKTISVCTPVIWRNFNVDRGMIEFMYLFSKTKVNHVTEKYKIRYVNY